MYQLLFYLLYKRFSTSAFNKTPFISAYFLTQTVLIIHLLSIYILFTNLIEIKFINVKEISVVFFIFVNLIEYFVIFKKRKIIIRKYYQNYSKRKFIQNLSLIFVLINNIFFPIIIKELLF